MSCKESPCLLADYVSEGEPAGERYAPLRRHLEQCGDCRDELARLRRVEQALRAWPLEQVDAQLHARLLATLGILRSPSDPVQQSWAIWVPALTVLLAITLALLLAPTLSPLAMHSLSGEIGLSSESAWHQEAVQAIWVGAALALAGAGLTTALVQGSLPRTAKLDSLRDRAVEAAEHIWHLASHSR